METDPRIRRIYPCTVGVGVRVPFVTLMGSVLLMGFSLGGFLGSIIAGKKTVSLSAFADLDQACKLPGGHYHDLVSMTAKLSNDKIPGSAPVSGKDKGYGG
jgi:hypothetical protein